MIVAAVGQSERNDRIVAEEKMLAESFDEQLRVVHVLSPMEAKKIEQDVVAETASATESDDGYEVATEIAADAATGVNDVTAVGLVEKASGKVIEYAGDHEARYVVIGGRKRSPTGEAVFGSVTQAILLNADQPVLTVK